MGERKVVGANVALTIGLISVIMLINLVWVATEYNAVIGNKDSQIQQNDARLASLNAQYQDSLLDEQLLSQQISSLESVHLWEINFKWEFVEPASGQHYLHFTGTFFNSGNTTATAVRTDVWISGGNVSIANFRVTFGDVPPKGYINFDKVLNYTGHADSYLYMVD